MPHLMAHWRSVVRSFCGTGVVMVCLAAPATAQRLDDSASPRSRVAAQVVMSEQGRALADTLNPRVALVRFGRVDYRLATAAYVGRQARIYFVVPAHIPGLRSPEGLRVDWAGHGRFAGGTARPGERQIVWSGIVQEPWFAESLELNWQVDLSQLDSRPGPQFAVEAYFEIEVIK